jgi:predicted DNA-binding ribbon-helix-helix protein
MGSTARDMGLEKPVKKSLVIAGHATSIALEPVFWEILKNMAETQACSLPELIAAIDAEPRPAGLSSALRQRAALFLQNHG